MKAYVLVTGALYAVLAVVHAWRIVEEGGHVTKDPFFAVSSVIALAFAVWSWRVFRQLPR